MKLFAIYEIDLIKTAPLAQVQVFATCTVRGGFAPDRLDWQCDRDEAPRVGDRFSLTLEEMP